MHPQTVFAKTPKGVLEVRNRTLRLARESGLVFLAVDGKTPVAALQQKARIDEATLLQALDKLAADGYITVVREPPKAEPAAAASVAGPDLDFTSSAATLEIVAAEETRARLDAQTQERAAAAPPVLTAAATRATEEARKTVTTLRAQARPEPAHAHRGHTQHGARAMSSTVFIIRRLIGLTYKVAIGIAIIAVLGLGFLHLVPLSDYVGGPKLLLSERLGEPVSIGSLRFRLFPAPQFRLENIAVGSQQDVTVETAIVPLTMQVLFSDYKDLDEVELLSVQIGAGAVPRLAAWAQPQPVDSRLRIKGLKSNAVKLMLPGLELPSFEAAIAFGADGGVQKVRLRDSKVSVDLAVVKNRELHANFSARNWRLPAGPALEFSELAGAAVINREQIAVSGIDGALYGGALKGAFIIKWGSGLAADGEFSLKGADIVQLLTAFTSDFAASGMLEMSAKFALQGKNPDDLFAAPRVTARFALLKGTLNNVDLVRAMQSPGRSAQDGGRTTFSAISGEVQAAASRISYRNLELRSPPLNCAGAIDVSPAGELSGRLNLTGSQTITVARNTLTVSGSVKSPRLIP